MANRTGILGSTVVLSGLLVAAGAVPAAAEPLLVVTPDSGEHAEFPHPEIDLRPHPEIDLFGPWGDSRPEELGSAIPEESDEASILALPPPDPEPDPGEQATRLSEAPVPSRPAYEVVLNEDVEFYLTRFTGSQREAVELWVSRSGRFMEMIRSVLRRYELPEELAFTAMIESGYNPLAVSRAGAKGMWQFMAPTARRYGLRVDRWVDERLDPEKSTIAAAAYLRDLHELFGSWPLAQAAYNAGETRIARAIRATGASDFWTLARSRYLKAETRNFVPQIQAAIIIGLEPEKYGFEFVEQAPPPVDRVVVPPRTDLRRVAARARIPFKTLRALNPVLVKGITPPGGRYEIKVPSGSRQAALAAVAPPKRAIVARKKGTSDSRDDLVHVVRARETVTSIARQYGVSVNDVLRWNRLAARDVIRPGDRLRITDLRLSADKDGQGGFR